MSTLGEQRPRRKRIALLVCLGCLGIAGLIATGYEAARRQEPRREEYEVQVPVQKYAEHKTLKDVTTPDGRTVKAFVKEQVAQTVTETVKKEAVRELTPEQRVRLNIVSGAACLVGLLFVAVVVAYAVPLCRGREPHKSVEDWLNRLGGTVVGVVLTFLGVPPPEGQVKPPEKPQTLVAPAAPAIPRPAAAEVVEPLMKVSLAVPVPPRTRRGETDRNSIPVMVERLTSP